MSRRRGLYTVDEQGGDFPSLAVALRDAEDGATIRLVAGQAPLDELIEISGTISVVGEGPGQSQIRLSGAGGLRVLAGGSLGLRRVSFFSAVGRDRALLDIRGELSLDTVELHGARAQDTSYDVLDSPKGLAASGRARIIARKSRFVEFRIGLDASGAASLSLDRCRLERCGAAITVHQRATVQVKGGRFVHGGTAARVTDSGVIRISELTFAKLQADVLVVDADGEVTVSDCVVERGAAGEARVADRGVLRLQEIRVKSQAGGVLVLDHASLYLERGQIEECGAVGVSVSGEARAEVTGTRFRANVAGVVVSDRGEAVLREVTALGCRHVGFGASGAGRLSAVACVASGNMQDGILVQDQARATLEANVCEGNLRAGIAFEGQGSGSATKNRCIGNVRWPIHTAASDVRPQLPRPARRWECPEELEDLLVRLEILLARQEPKLYESLNPPARSVDLKVATDTLGAPLPPGCEALYRWHNGSRPAGRPRRHDRLQFLSLTEAVAAALEFRRDPSLTALEDGWGAGWLPVLRSRDRDRVICLDGDAAFGGRAGQIIDLTRPLPARRILAPSLEALLTSRLDGPKAGPKGYPVVTWARQRITLKVRLTGNITE